MYDIKFNDNDYPSESYVIDSCESLEDAVDFAYDYLVDKYNGDLDGDTEENIKNALTVRQFYVIGYGEADITIEKTV